MSSSSSPSSATTRFSGRSGNAADNAPKVGAVDGRPPAGATNVPDGADDDGRIIVVNGSEVKTVVAEWSGAVEPLFFEWVRPF